MANRSDFQKAIELINKSENILLTTHIRPDGDACGSTAALAKVLNSQGKNVQTLLLTSLPEWYEFLFDKKPVVLDEDITPDDLNQGKLGEYDLIIIVDTNSSNQLQGFNDFLKQNDKPVLTLDHHVTNDGLGDVEIIDTSAAAAGVIIFDLLKAADWTLTKSIAQSIFVAIATDTGWFRFTNTDARVHKVCAELIEAGINPAQLYHDLYQSFSPQRFKLMSVMFDNLTLHFDGRYASQHLTLADFERTGAAHKDTENLIDECQRINTVEAAALFLELSDGRVKCSLRSRGLVNVREIAQKFGGGGHTMASGTHLPGPLENAKQLIYEEMKKQIQ